MKDVHWLIYICQPPSLNVNLAHVFHMLIIYNLI